MHSWSTSLCLVPSAFLHVQTHLKLKSKSVDIWWNLFWNSLLLTTTVLAFLVPHMSSAEMHTCIGRRNQTAARRHDIQRTHATGASTHGRLCQHDWCRFCSMIWVRPILIDLARRKESIWIYELWHGGSYLHKAVVGSAANKRNITTRLLKTIAYCTITSRSFARTKGDAGPSNYVWCTSSNAQFSCCVS